jgi:site-specific recombinase XerD
MGRTANAKLDTAAARKRLKPRVKPYCQSIAPRRMLGYIRAPVGAGRWLSIVEVGRGVSGSALRRQGDLGLADDVSRADGDTVLSYLMAVTAAAAWQPADARARDLDVRGALQDYIGAKRAADGADAAEDAYGRLRLHVLCEDQDGVPLPGRRGLGDRPIKALTLTELRAWRDALVTREVGPVSRSTANRIIANFKAMLNYAYSDEDNRIPSDSAWRRLESFENAETARLDHFTEVQMLKLIEGAREQDPLFADLLEAAFHTGARLPKELALCDVRHFDAKHGQISIVDGKTGPRVTQLTQAGIEFFRRVTAGRGDDDILLPRADGKRWGKSQQHRPMKAALKAAKLPSSASVYTIRHTYISRSIENGMPLTLIAENVGTSVGMIEKYYAKIIARVRRKLVDKHAPRLRVVKAA